MVSKPRVMLALSAIALAFGRCPNIGATATPEPKSLYYTGEGTYVVTNWGFWQGGTKSVTCTAEIENAELIIWLATNEAYLNITHARLSGSIADGSCTTLEGTSGSDFAGEYLYDGLWYVRFNSCNTGMGRAEGTVVKGPDFDAADVAGGADCYVGDSSMGYSQSYELRLWYQGEYPGPGNTP